MEQKKNNHDVLINIGNKLKQRREELSYSIRKVSEITRISTPILQCIEDGDYTEFPNLVFIRGFIRNYCKLLNIETDPIIKELNAFYRLHSMNLDALPDEVDANNKTYQDFTFSSENYSKIFFAILSGLVIIVGLVFFLFQSDLFSSNDDEAIALINTQNEVKQDNTSTQQQQQQEEVVKTLDLNALENGWIRLKIDDNAAFEQYIIQGENYNFEIKEKINLILAKGSLADMSINGEKVSIESGQRNQLLSFEIDISKRNK